MITGGNGLGLRHKWLRADTIWSSISSKGKRSGIAFGDHSAHTKAGFKCRMPVQTPQSDLPTIDPRFGTGTACTKGRQDGFLHFSPLPPVTILKTKSARSATLTNGKITTS
jgi:hypothetical protein